MKSRLILLALAWLFVFAQYVSIEQTTTIIASAVMDSDDLDDLSVEDVVPVDPFLAPADAKLTDHQHITPEREAPACYFTGSVVAAAASSRSRNIQKLCLGSPPLKRWLVNRALLI